MENKVERVSIYKKSKTKTKRFSKSQTTLPSTFLWGTYHKHTTGKQECPDTKPSHDSHQLYFHTAEFTVFIVAAKIVDAKEN